MGSGEAHMRGLVIVWGCGNRGTDGVKIVDRKGMVARC